MLTSNEHRTNNPLKIEKGIPINHSTNRRPMLIDWSSLEDGDSVLVENEKRAMVVVSCFNHFKKRNPDKLVGMKTTWRKEHPNSEERRIHFIKTI
jgi:hypothetical protein